MHFPLHYANGCTDYTDIRQVRHYEQLRGTSHFQPHLVALEPLTIDTWPVAVSSSAMVRPVCRRRLDSTSRQYMWDLWWTKWHSVPLCLPVIIIPLMLHIYIYIYIYIYGSNGPSSPLCLINYVFLPTVEHNYLVVDVCYLLHKYQVHVSSLMAIFRLNELTIL